MDIGGGGGGGNVVILAGPEAVHQFIIQSAWFERSTASRDYQTIYTTLSASFKLICSWAPPPLRPPDTNHVMDNTSWLPLFFTAIQLASMYYCQCKPKNRTQGRPGNEAQYTSLGNLWSRNEMAHPLTNPMMTMTENPSDIANDKPILRPCSTRGMERYQEDGGIMQCT